jgi:hypothetical protein
MIHKKSCFGRTFEQDTQASEPDGKSWSDDKFYENLQAKKKTAQAQHGQCEKLGPVFQFRKLTQLELDEIDNDIYGLENSSLLCNVNYRE